MAKPKRENTQELLKYIAEMGSKGNAEAEPDQKFLQRYLPLPEHARALDPGVILIIGDRGAGKTELFRAIQFPAGLEAIKKLGGGDNLPNLTKSKWLVGYSSSGTEFPAELAFRQFAQEKQPADLQLIWLGLLLRSLRHENLLSEDAIPLALHDTLTANPLILSTLFSVVGQHLEACFAALDALDVSLAEQSEWVFINYDELDRVSAGDWDALRTILRGLVQFWSSYARRWKRIRPKLFLRRDLFDRVALFGPDVSKIAAQRVELVWTIRNLYALTAKRMINHHNSLWDYFDPVMPAGEVRGELGWSPSEKKEEGYRKFIERLCGKYMGASADKGYSFTWIPNHLQDGRGRVLPRSMVRLFEGAAEIELMNQKAEWPRLLHHSSLREAVDKVSDSRAQEIEDEEFPWIKTIRSEIAKVHPQVPIDRWEFERLLNINWEGVNDKPPETSARGLLQLLMELGIFYLRADGRVDARDLYLKGFGLKRKGGVARPRR